MTSLLGLVGIEADPLSSREHVLLANLIENAWRAGRTSISGADRLGADATGAEARRLRGRHVLSAGGADRARPELNALVASPSFAAWGEGQPLDPATLLRTPEGKPRCAIVYLAHLSDQERQFVVTLVLSKLVTWMRGQPGTSDLRTLVYMDEVFRLRAADRAAAGEEADPHVLKQGRAFGVGMALATQNPVDLDYKAMSNAGTWLVGRLQTERDKARVLEAAGSAAGSTDVRARYGDRRPAEAAVPARQRETLDAGAVPDPLGDVVSPRPADEGADRAADAGRGRGGRARRPPRRRPPRSRGATTRLRWRRAWRRA